MRRRRIIAVLAALGLVAVFAATAQATTNSNWVYGTKTGLAASWHCSPDYQVPGQPNVNGHFNVCIYHVSGSASWQSIVTWQDTVTVAAYVNTAIEDNSKPPGGAWGGWVQFNACPNSSPPLQTQLSWSSDTAHYWKCFNPSHTQSGFTVQVRAYLSQNTQFYGPYYGPAVVVN